MRGALVCRLGESSASGLPLMSPPVRQQAEVAFDDESFGSWFFLFGLGFFVELRVLCAFVVGFGFSRPDPAYSTTNFCIVRSADSAACTFR